MANDFVVELRVDLTGDLNGQISRQLGDASRQFNDFDSKVSKTQKTLDGAGKKQKDFQQSLSTTRYALYDVSSSLTVTGVALLGLAVATTAVAIAWERDFANVARTTGLVGPELEDMRVQLVDLAQTMPTAFGDITKIATLGAQLGVANEDLSEFTQTVVKFSAASGISAEESAQAFGRLGNILGVSADQYDNLGSSIVKAGISAVATESEIVAVAQQIGPIARLAGASASQVIGLATAFASVKIPPELARSVITKTFGDITRAVANGGPKLEAFGKAMGTSGAEFKKAWNADATGTFVNFLEAIPKDAGGAIRTLDELGLSSQRNTPALQKLAQNTELVRKSLREAGVGFDENTELNRQFGIIAETTAARLQVLANNFMAFLDAVGSANLGPLGDMLDFLSGFLGMLTDLASTDWGGNILGIVTILGGLAGVLALGAGALALFGASSIGVQQGLKGIIGLAPVASARILGVATSADIAAGGMRAAGASAKLLMGALKALSLIGIVLLIPDLSSGFQDLVNQFSGASTEIKDRVKDLEGSIEGFGYTLGLTNDVGANFGKMVADFGMPATEANRKIKELDDQLASLAENGGAEEAAKQLDGLRETLGAAGIGSSQFDILFQDAIEAIGGVPAATSEADAGFATLEEAMAATQSEAQATQDEINALKQAILDFGNTSITVEQTQIALSKAFNDMAEAAAAEGASLTGTDAASLNLRQSYIDMEKASRDAAIAIVENGGSVEAATAKYNEGRDAIIQSRIAKGEDAAAAAAWADATLGSAGEAQGAIAAFSAEINKIPQPPPIIVTANTDIANSELRNFLYRVNSSSGTVRVYTQYVTGAGPLAPDYAIFHRAEGGPIYGPGTSRSDSIPAMLSNGEYVIRAAAVAKYGQGFMNAINSGKAPKFASGGSVGGSSAAPSMMGGVMELGPKTIKALAMQVSVSGMGDVEISRMAESGNAKRRSTGDIR